MTEPLTTNENPWQPIATATDDDYEPGDPIGYGPTEQAAIEDLKQQIEEAA